MSIKNKDDFTFVITKNKEIIPKNTETYLSDCKRVKLYINGVIYNKNFHDLINDFFNKGISFVNDIEGSFILFLYNTYPSPSLYVITDKVNSKKAFYTIDDKNISISTDIDDLPLKEKDLNLAGIGCYLANGVMHNNITLFKGVKSFKQGSINRLNNGELSEEIYWHFKFNYTKNNHTDENQLCKKLEKLLLDSVKKRMETCENISLLLSGGYDSRGILGVFGEKFDAKNVKCFSYSLNSEPLKKTDSYLARDMARLYNYNFEEIQSYYGDFFKLLKENAFYGKGIANFCGENEVYNILSGYNITDIFVGDHCFVWKNVPLASTEDALEAANVSGKDSIIWLKIFLPRKKYNEIQNSLVKLMNDIKASANNIQNFHDKREFFYLTQYNNNVKMPWREYFTIKAGFVHNPYLDGDILEFITEIPPDKRKNKILFIKTMENLFPDLFRITTASKIENYIYRWHIEICRNKNELINMVYNTESRLDEIIPKKTVVKLINANDSKALYYIFFTNKILNYLRKKNIIFYRLSSFFGINKKFVHPTTLVIRLLVLRIYLSK